ncbi:MAG: hypothetical protein LBU65_03910 [Planctomycetaceae bacterium]|jgi:hypothetical protein|nr:hypothetical protein [Planctomycetaceae bacterium]
MTIKNCIRIVFCLVLLVAVFFAIIVFCGHVVYYTHPDRINMKIKKICESHVQIKDTNVMVFSLIAYSSSEFSLFFYMDKERELSIEKYSSSEFSLFFGTNKERESNTRERVVICKAPSRYNKWTGAWEVKLYPVFCGDGTCGFAPYNFNKEKRCETFAEFSLFELLPKSENKNYTWYTSHGPKSLLIMPNIGVAAGIFYENSGCIFVGTSPPKVSCNDMSVKRGNNILRK